jgi:hypothetical protein
MCRTAEELSKRDIFCCLKRSIRRKVPHFVCPAENAVHKTSYRCELADALMGIVNGPCAECVCSIEFHDDPKKTSPSSNRRPRVNQSA